jgi:hypothetical protein
MTMPRALNEKDGPTLKPLTSISRVTCIISVSKA